MLRKEKLSQSILSMAADRGVNKSVCPSEIARALFPVNWRAHMQEIRDQAVELQKEGKVKITQKGVAVDANYIKGPVRITII